MTGGEIDLVNRRAADLPVHAVFADVAVGSDAHVETRAVAACEQIPRPVALRIPRQVEQLDAGRRDLRVAVRVWEADDRIGVRDVEIPAHQRHAERRMQPLQKDATRLGATVGSYATQ